MEEIRRNLSVNSSMVSLLNEKLAIFLYSIFSDGYNYPSNWMQSFYSLLYSSIPFKRLSRSALPAYYSSHTIHQLNKLRTESKLSLGSNTGFITAKSELLQSIELDTNWFLNKFYQDNPTGCQDLFIKTGLMRSTNLYGC